MSIATLLGVKEADFQRGNWQVFEQDVFNQFKADGVQEARIQKRFYGRYTNNSNQCHLCDDLPRYLVDLVSKQLYVNRSKGDMQDRFCIIAALIPVVGVVMAVVHIALSVLKVVSLYAVWGKKQGVMGWGVDLLRLLATPLSLIAAQGLALYGMINPQEGMKAWTTFGRVAFGSKEGGVFFNPFIFENSFDYHPHDHIEEDIRLGDFCPINTWTPEEIQENKGYFGRKGCKDCPKDTPQMIRDETTDRLYFNDLPSVIRIKGLAMFVFSLTIHPVALSCNIVFRVFKIVTFYHFWRGCEKDKPYDLKGRVQHLTADVFRVALAPLLISALCLSAIYMVARPKDGKKLYSAFVRAEYGHFLMEPCLHPGFKLPHRDYNTAREFLRLRLNASPKGV